MGLEEKGNESAEIPKNLGFLCWGTELMVLKEGRRYKRGRFMFEAQGFSFRQAEF